MDDPKDVSAFQDKKNEHENMPVKNPATDSTDQMHSENGLNVENTDANELDTGIRTEDPDFTETD